MEKWKMQLNEQTNLMDCFRGSELSEEERSVVIARLLQELEEDGLFDESIED